MFVEIANLLRRWWIVEEFSPSVCQARLIELHRLWDLLLLKLREKGIKLLQAQKLIQFFRIHEQVMFWIHDKVSLCKTSNYSEWKEVVWLSVDVQVMKFVEFESRCEIFNNFFINDVFW